jgi:carbon-monoxide dehydrogenase medium subunit
MLGSFRIHSPTSIAQAVECLVDFGEDAAPYAGCTELILAMKAGFMAPEHLVDLKGIPELRRIEVRDDVVEVGATAPYVSVHADPGVARVVPTLSWLSSRAANIRVRSVGTLGGNLCFAEPHSDPASLLLAYDAEIECVGPSGTRRVSISEFIVGAYETTRAMNEILTRILIPTELDRLTGFRRLAVFERPTANAAVCLSVEGRRIVRGRVVTGAAGPFPSRVPDAENLLAGADLADDLDVAAAVGIAAREHSDVSPDAYGSEDYKRSVVGELARRAFIDATTRAGELDGRS